MKKRLLIFILLAANLVYSQNLVDKKKLRYGVVLGQPIQVLLAIGNDYKSYSYRVGAGGWFNGAYGFQGEVFYKVHQRNSLKQNLGLICGYTHGTELYEKKFYNYYFRQTVDNPEEIESFYIGPAYKINWSHFFVQTSAAIGTENFKYPRLLLQLGYYF